MRALQIMCKLLMALHNDVPANSDFPFCHNMVSTGNLIAFWLLQEEKTSMRVLLNMGKAEVELLQGSQDNPANLKPLARFLVGGLWISYRMTHTGWPNVAYT